MLAQIKRVCQERDDKNGAIRAFFNDRFILLANSGTYDALPQTRAGI